jgi:hypothetical protein
MRTFYRLLPAIAGVLCTLGPTMIDAVEKELFAVDALISATESRVNFAVHQDSRQV